MPNEPKISLPAQKYLKDTWANFVSWQANIRLGAALFAQNRVNINLISEENREEVSNIVDENMVALKIFLNGKENFGEMMFCRLMDDFEYYLFDISFRIFKNNPKILKNSEEDKNNLDVSISLNDIIGSIDDIDHILHLVVNKKLDSIKRNQGGYVGLVQYMENKLNGRKRIISSEQYSILKNIIHLEACLIIQEDLLMHSLSSNFLNTMVS